MQIKNFFFFTVFLSMIQPYIWSGKIEPIIIILYLFYFILVRYGMSKIIEDQRFWKNTFQDLKAPKLFSLRGAVLKDEKDDQESEYIDQMSVKKRAYRLAFSLIVICTPPLGVLLNLVQIDFFFKGSNIVFFSMLLGLINSSFYGHYILVSVMSLLISLFLGTEHLISLVPIISFVFIAQVILAKIIIDGSDKFNRDAIFMTLKYWLVFCTTAFLIQLAMPKKFDWLKEKKWLAQKLSAPSLPKGMQDQPIQIPQTDALKRSIRHSKKDIDSLVEKLNELEINIDTTSLPLDIKANIKGMSGDARELQRQLSNPDLSAKELADISKSLSKLKLKVKTSKVEFEKFNQNLKDSAEKFPSEYYDQLQDDIQMKGISDKFNSLKDLKLENIKTEITKHKETFDKAFESEQKEKLKNEIIRRKKLSEERKKQEYLETLKKWSRVAVVFLLFLIILLVLKRKKVKNLDLKDEKVIRKLQAEYRKLSSRKLSPEEEVIQNYNFFKRSLKEIYFEQWEVPPPSITHKYLIEELPRFNKASYYLKEIFSHCYYNDKKISKKDLRIFRSSFQGIMKYLLR